LNKNLIGVVGFILNGGTYKCDIIGKDAVDSEKKRSITEIIEVKPFYQLGIAMGDVQLASNIIQGSDNTSSIFYKNSFEVMPTPTGTFGEKQPVLFYYTELYNIISQDDSKLRIDKHIINSRGQVVNQKSKSIGRSLDTRVEVGTVMTYKLPTDTYTLVLSLIDSSSNYGVSSSKKFFVYNPSVEYVDTFKTQGSNLVVGMFGVMSEEELDDFFEKSRYIASVPEIQKYENLTTENAKSKYLTEFWKARDEDPSDDMNHYLKDYLRRLKESNVRFKALSREGWKTDRGRVYLIYGQPSEVDRYPNQTESRPYEIWYYHDIEGGVQFNFGDISGFSDYVLLHSTKRGELRDDNWQRRIIIR
jgi:GWxTD domain-containing protein